MLCKVTNYHQTKREKAETFSLLPQTIVNAHCVCTRILAIPTAKLVENLIRH